MSWPCIILAVVVMLDLSRLQMVYRSCQARDGFVDMGHGTWDLGIKRDAPRRSIKDNRQITILF